MNFSFKDQRFDSIINKFSPILFTQEIKDNQSNEQNQKLIDLNNYFVQIEIIVVDFQKTNYVISFDSKIVIIHKQNLALIHQFFTNYFKKN